VAIELLRITVFSKKMRRKLYVAISYMALILLEAAVYLLLSFFVL